MQSNSLGRGQCGWLCLVVILFALFGGFPAIADILEAVPEQVAVGAAKIDDSADVRGLTLAEALALALDGSPTLASYSRGTEAGRAEAVQAGVRPNPGFVIDVENFGGSGELERFESAETTLFVAQLVELGGKRSKRRSAADQAVRVAEWEYEAARLDLIAETAEAFTWALATQQSVRLAEEQIALAREVLQTVRDRAAQGSVSQVEVLRVQLEVTNQVIDWKRRVRASRAARVRLATIWGDFEPGFGRVEGDLLAVPRIPSEAELVEGMSRSPSLARWQAEVNLRRAEVELENANGIPDLTLGLGPRHFNGTNDWAVVMGLEVPIPVFDRNQGARQAAGHALERSEEDRRGAALALRRDISEAYRDLAMALDEAVLLRDEGVPTAKKAFRDSQAAHEDGVIGFLEVLDAQRSLFDMRTRLVLALASHHIARARLEALIGGPLEPGDAR